MSRDELYEATRGVWKVGKKREQAEFAFAVYEGIVREVYQIWRCLPAGTLVYKYRDSSKFDRDRWEFEGTVADEFIREQYVGKPVRSYFPNGNQNPVKYVNIE